MPALVLAYLEMWINMQKFAFRWGPRSFSVLGEVQNYVKYIGPYRRSLDFFVKCIGPYRRSLESNVKYIGPYRQSLESLVKYVGPYRRSLVGASKVS